MGLLVARASAVVGGDYSLSDATDGIAIQPTHPTEPTITSSATVNTSTLAANLVNGRRLTLQAGSYGDRTITTDDQELILQDGANIGTLTLNGVNRFIIRGETTRVGSIVKTTVNSTSTDILFKETVFLGATTNDQNEIYGDRVAFLSCSITEDRYCFYVDAVTDFIVGNCNCSSTAGSAPTCRVMNSVRSVVADSRLHNTGPQTCYRQHADSTDAEDHYLVRTQVEIGPIQFSADGDGNDVYERLISVTIDDIDFYSDGGYISTDTGDKRPEILVVTDSRGYGLLEWPPELLPAWDISNNSNVAFTTPPAWSFN